MEEPRYNNRQVEKMLKQSTDDIKEFISLKVDPLAAAVTYTNGKVRFNEKMIYMALGAMLLVTPMLSWFILDYLDFKDQYRDDIKVTVETVLGNYEFDLIE
tara:strand:- start:1235 stop:1537 length:303 start_codon:yes stop_codon:yes gene_type:complete